MAVPPPGIPTLFDKAALRRRLRTARRDFDRQATGAMRGAIVARIGAAVGERGLADRALVGGYVACGGEPDVLPAMVRLSDIGHMLALPRLYEGNTMRFVAWTAGEALTPGRFAIREPDPGPPVVPDMLLVPLVGFDRNGHRLGQGGGYYDRWLAAHRRTITIGIGWSVQEIARLPLDRWDIPLDIIVTERETIRP